MRWWSPWWLALYAGVIAGIVAGVVVYAGLPLPLAAVAGGAVGAVVAVGLAALWALSLAAWMALAGRAGREREPFSFRHVYKVVHTWVWHSRRSKIAELGLYLPRAALAIIDLPARWLMSLLDALISDKGYITAGSIIAAYLAVFGLIDTKSTQEETRASVERSLFITLVSAGNAQSFVAAMKTFGPVQTMRITDHPDLFRPWEWGNRSQPNLEPLGHWADARLPACSPKDCSLDPAHRIDLSGADLTGASLADSNLTNANLSGVNLIGADLTLADLTGADLTDADLTGANLTGANLTDAYLTNATLLQASLTNANLLGTNVTQDQLDKAWCGSKGAKLPPKLTIKPCPGK
jgi:hypothetical protein